MRRAGILAMVAALVVGACGSGDDLAGELLGVVAVVEVPASELVQVGRDIPGEVVAADADARLEVIEIPAGTPMEETFEDGAGIERPVFVVRDPLGRGSLTARLEGADRVFVLVIPLLVPTRGEVDHAARLVALSGGEVVGADWSEDATRRLAGILDGEPDPFAVMVRTIRALADDQLGRPVGEEERRLIDAVEG